MMLCWACDCSVLICCWPPSSSTIFYWLRQPAALLSVTDIIRVCLILYFCTGSCPSILFIGPCSSNGILFIGPCSSNAVSSLFIGPCSSNAVLFLAYPYPAYQVQVGIISVQHTKVVIVNFSNFLALFSSSLFLVWLFASHANYDGHVLYMRALQQLVSSFYRRG